MASGTGKKSWFLSLALVLSLSFLALADDAKPGGEPKKVPEVEVQTQFEGLLNATQDKDYAGFLQLVDEDVKAALTKPVFEKVADEVAPRLKAGYKTEYFGFLDKKGYQVHLWKLIFEDKGDDTLVEMSIKDKKVGGIFLR